MPVRDARVADVAAIADMIREHAVHEGAPEQCHFDGDRGATALFGPAPTLRALVAHPDGEPATAAGCALWYPTFSSWAATSGIWLEDLYVRPPYRRLGLGRELLDALRAMTDGRIEWDVHRDNTGAPPFYESLGAHPVPEWVRWRWLP